VGTTEELPTVLSFCSGYGGIERGIELAGVEHRVLAYVEIEAYVIANLLAKMESGELAPAPIWTNLETFPAHLFRGTVDIITGGYPCQPFSAAGSRKGADDSRHLFPYIKKHIKTIRPDRCFFENVEGHISLGLSSVISDLEEDGYRTAWGIFSAREVGAPHQRKRVYILADSQSERVQGLRASGKQKPGAHGQQELLVCQGKGSEYAKWLPEPRVGRVVDGCTDRVDRLRLLGNGVVPQTAAKAWQVLGERYDK